MFMYRRLKRIIDRSGPSLRNSIASAFLAAVVLIGAYSEALAAADRSRLVAADALGEKLADSSMDIDGRAEKLGLKSNRDIRGSVDAAAREADGKVQISGWAFNPAECVQESLRAIFSRWRVFRRCVDRRLAP